MVTEIVFIDLVINGSSEQTGIIRNPLDQWSERMGRCNTCRKSEYGDDIAQSEEGEEGINSTYPTHQHERILVAGSHGLTKLTVKLIGSDG